MRTDTAFDGFASAVLIGTLAMLGLFVLAPLAHSVLIPAALAWRRLFSSGVWSTACFGGDMRGVCGAGWHTLGLGFVSAMLATLIGTSLALLSTRALPAKTKRTRRVLRGLALLPAITPPFAVGLALILLLGRNGLATRAVASMFDMPAGRWVYGPIGIVLAQCLAFAPLAYLTVVGVIEQLPAVLEEAATTLRASRWTVFRTITWPMMRPGIANALLLCFIESVADFGDPLVIGGNFRVLSTDLYFAVVGAEQDAGRAGVLAIWLLVLALVAFALQRLWLGNARFTILGGKPTRAQPVALDSRFSALLIVLCVPWCALALAVYATLIFGGFVRLWGVDFGFTLGHFTDVLGLAVNDGRIVASGGAWDAVFETLRLAAIASVCTAAAALIVAWLLERRRFAGRRMLDGAFAVSLAVPGTVMGLAWAHAFAAPPMMLVGSGTILVLAFVLRNMPLGLRAASAALAQIDHSLDEASATMRASSWTTLRLVLLPLLKPAIAAALIQGFVRAATSVSAVIFLVSVDHDVVATYLMSLVSNGDDGASLALAGVLIVVLFVLVCLAQAISRSDRREAESSASDIADNVAAHVGNKVVKSMMRMP